MQIKQFGEKDGKPICQIFFGNVEDVPNPAMKKYEEDMETYENLLYFWETAKLHLENFLYSGDEE